MSTRRPRHGRPRSPRGSGRQFLRGLSGCCAGGLVVLAVALVVVRLVVGTSSLPGPAGSTLVGHGAFAAVAVGAQVLADREDSRRSTVASVGIVVLTFVVLWIWWWR